MRDGDNGEPFITSLQGIRAHRPPRISVIIPTLNEADHLERAVASARTAPAVEIIVVDGGSADGTPEIARQLGVKVVTSRRSRAAQMNTGAAVARAEALLFLHADAELPDAYGREVLSLLATPGAVLGAFQFRLDDRRPILMLIERLVAFRSRWIAMPYGDQGLFMRTATFRALGGFPDIPIMEDYELVRRARRVGRVVLADAAVTTSARRWTRNGPLLTTLLNQLCLMAWMFGMSAERIATWRSRAKPRPSLATPPRKRGSTRRPSQTFSG